MSASDGTTAMGKPPKRLTETSWKKARTITDPVTDTIKYQIGNPSPVPLMMVLPAQPQLGNAWGRSEWEGLLRYALPEHIDIPMGIVLCFLAVLIPYFTVMGAIREAMELYLYLFGEYPADTFENWCEERQNRLAQVRRRGAIAETGGDNANSFDGDDDDSENADDNADGDQEKGFLDENNDDEVCSTSAEVTENGVIKIDEPETTKSTKEGQSSTQEAIPAAESLTDVATDLQEEKANTPDMAAVSPSSNNETEDMETKLLALIRGTSSERANLAHDEDKIAAK